MRKLPWGIIFLVIWGLFLTTSVTLYLNFLQPAKLGPMVSSILESNLKLSPRIDFIKLQFFPRPAIIIKDISLSNQQHNVKIKINTVHAGLSWKTLLAGKPVIGSIDIFNPTVEFVSSKGFPQKEIEALQIEDKTKSTEQNILMLKKEKQELLEQKINTILTKFINFEIPYFFADASLHLRNGLIKIKFSESNDFISIDNIDVDLRLPGIINGLLDLRIEQIKLMAQRAPEIELSQTSLLVTGWRLDTSHVTANMHLQSQFQMGDLQKLRVKPIKKAYQYFPMPKPAYLSIRKNLSYDKKTSSLAVDGIIQAKLLLPMNAHNTPVAIDIPFSLNGTTINDNKSSLDFKRTRSHKFVQQS